LDKFEDKKIVV